MLKGHQEKCEEHQQSPGVRAGMEEERYRSPACVRPHRRAVRSGQGERGSSQVADVRFVFDFWLIKGQLLATVPTSRAFANI